MATVKRPGDGAENGKSDRKSTTKEQRFHKTEGGATWPIVRTYFDRRNNCVVDVYEKTRSQRARSLDTGQMEMVPGIKTQTHTFCKDVKIQKRELEKRGFTMTPVLDSNGSPQLDKNGEPMFEITQTAFTQDDIDVQEDL